jgi:hypothetical protein
MLAVWILAVCCLLAFALGASLGLYLGLTLGERRAQKEALQQGAPGWQIDARTGARWFLYGPTPTPPSDSTITKFKLRWPR